MPKLGFLAFIHNPVVLAVITVASIGIIAYEIYSHNKQRQKHSYGGRDDGPRYPPPPDSPKLPPSPPPKRWMVRRRKPGKRDESGSDGPEDQRSDAVSEKKVNSDSSEENSKYPQDGKANDTPNQCNLNLDSILPVNEKIYEKHVLNESADRNRSSSVNPENEVLNETDESNRNSSLKVRRKKRSIRKSGSVSSDSSESVRGKKLNIVCGCKSGSISSHSRENQLSEQSDGPSKSSSPSDGYSSPYSLLSEEEAIAYKNKVHDNIQNDTVKVINSEDGIGYSSTGSSKYDVLNVCESGICQACDENRVNTRTDPCNHRYLCLSCARKIHRIYKRCSICRHRITQFHII